MTYKNIHFEIKEKNIAVLTLNRPDRLNALDNETFAEMSTLFMELEDREDFRVLIVTGEGRAFCAGGDVKGQPTRFGWPRDRHQDRLRAVHFGVVKALTVIKQPTMALINGVAAGGGLSLALACDLRLACQSARFGAGFRRVALAVDMGLSYFLPRMVGMGKAYEILYSGELLSAEEALQIGLVNRLIPDDLLWEQGMALARSIASGPPLAFRIVKQAIASGAVSGLDAALELEAALQSLCLSSEDHREGATAFLEKREPVFKGK